MITISYRSCVGHIESRNFKTLKYARRYAARWLGADPEVHPCCAVSANRYGRVFVTGSLRVAGRDIPISPADLFPLLELPSERLPSLQTA